MQKIVPHLWYDTQAHEAAEFYVTLFDNAVVHGTNILEDTPSGDAETVEFQLEGIEFAAISAGPYFQFNPSVSLMVYCDTPEEVDKKWNALIDGGSELMPLGEYPFSKRYGWLQDRFGLSWQLMFSDNNSITQKIVPNLLFSMDSCGKAEEAIRFYAEVFQHAAVGFISRYTKGEAQSDKAQINFASFKLEEFDFSAMDNAFDVDYSFNEAFSFIVNCDSQEEIDYFWEKLSAVPEAEQCGWLKDAYGLSWQIVPTRLEELMADATPDQVKRIVDAFLEMKKFDIAALELAYLGETDRAMNGNRTIDDKAEEKPRITVQVLVPGQLEHIWHCFTTPEHIIAWNQASDDWHTTASTNDLRPGGSFSSRMEAKDGSFGFDFGGVYDEVLLHHKIAYTLGDGRKVEITFQQLDYGVQVTETFEAEQENTLDLQRAGWQAILDNFKRHASMGTVNNCPEK